MKALQKLSIPIIILGLVLMFVSGNIEAGAKIITFSFFGSIVVILLGFLLLAISTIALRKKAMKKAQTPVKKKPRTELPFSKADWDEVLAQARQDLTPEQLKACEYSSPKKDESQVLTPEEFAALSL